MSLLGVLQILVSLALVLLILLQGRSSGLASPFGGGGGETFKTRRGFEKIIFYLTIFLAFSFALILLLVVVA